MRSCSSLLDALRVQALGRLAALVIEGGINLARVQPLRTYCSTAVQHLRWRTGTSTAGGRAVRGQLQVAMWRDSTGYPTAAAGGRRRGGRRRCRCLMPHPAPPASAAAARSPRAAGHVMQLSQVLLLTACQTTLCAEWPCQHLPQQRRRNAAVIGIAPLQYPGLNSHRNRARLEAAPWCRSGQERAPSKHYNLHQTRGIPGAPSPSRQRRAARQ